MNEYNERIYRNISNDMSSALMILDLNGNLQYANPAAREIIGYDASGNIVQMFIGYEENDRFIQLLLDSVYQKNRLQEGIVPFKSDTNEFTLRIKTSYLKEDDACIGVICMMDDITELYELKDAVRAMNEIKRLNESLTLRNELLYSTFGRFLSDDIVKELLDTENGLKLGGNKREVTVLMSDLRGFTALSERMPASDLIEMLNNYLAEMTAVIQKYRGTIIEFLGDGIFVIFGAPVAFGEHAELAVAAAVEMQSVMPKVNAWNAEHGFPELQMGIGINTSEVIIGNIGSEKRTKYGAVGYGVNTAGRIESYTTGGQILVSAETYDLIPCEITHDAEFEITAKGRIEPIHIYSVNGIGAPYNVSCKSAAPEEPFAPLPAPKPISFNIFSGKTSESKVHRGMIFELSNTAARMETDIPLKVYTDISIDIGRPLYAKVTVTDGKISTVTFTSKPDRFDEWKNKALS